MRRQGEGRVFVRRQGAGGGAAKKQGGALHEVHTLSRWVLNSSSLGFNGTRQKSVKIHGAPQTLNFVCFLTEPVQHILRITIAKIGQVSFKCI